MKPGLDRGWYGVRMDKEKVRGDWAAEGFSFGIFRDPPGQEWNDFMHATDEYVVVAEGCLMIEIGGVRYEARHGDRARIPAHVTHSLKTLSADGSVWFYGYGSARDGQ